MHLSGKTINLISEDYTATIVTMGGAIAGLRFHGRDITMPFDPESIPVAHQGKILAPWPNRISDGKYSFEDHDYQLAITELSTMSASHGLVAWKDWHILEMTSSSVALRTYVSPIYGYPFLIRMTARYELVNGMGLRVSVRALNEGPTPAPYGVGMHPYITCNQALIDDCKLTMPFTKCFSLTERKVPDQEVDAASLGFDFTHGRKIGNTEIDHCFISSEEKRMNTVLLENDDLQVYCKTNGLTPCTPYELRHTFVSVVKTLPAGEVKQLVGHSQDMDTFGVYGHALTGDDETTAQAVNGVFLRVLKTAQ